MNNRKISEENGSFISTDVSGNEYIEYSYKYTIVVIFFIYSLANSAYLVTFAPIVEQISNNYGISNSEIDLAYSLGGVGYLLLAIPTNKVIEERGVRTTIQMTVIFIIVGLLLRLLLNTFSNGFLFAILGNFVASLGRACSTHACTKVSVKWFLPRNRPLISSILLLGAPLGTILGYQITIWFIPPGDGLKG